MLSMLVIAEVSTAHPEAANGITKIIEDFGINLPSIFAQVLSFTIVAFILWRFAFKPVIATLDERQKKIADGLRYSEETKARLDSVQQENAATLKRAQLEAAAIIEQAHKTSKELSEREKLAATEQANALITKAQQAIELEKQKMLNEVRGEISRLVVTTTQRVLAKELSDADRSRYNESAAHELASV